jgi:molybdopterin converting factor small subunit
MSIKIHLHKTQRTLTNGLEIIEAQGSTVGECLNQLVRQFPGLGEKLFVKKGKLHNHVEIYVNLETAYPDELAKVVKDGDDIHVTMMLAGG